MRGSDRAAVGRFVLRTKEHLVLIQVRDGVLALTTLLFAEEVRSTKDVEAATAKRRRPGKRELDEAIALIEALSCSWDPGRYRDRYRSRLRKVANRKKHGKTIQAPRPEKTPGAVPDLMAALERSLEEARR